MRTSTLPDGLPILSRGRHRNPKRGACFMELASVLAGERWSDHPSCTHPLLAQLARQVNDAISDEGRRLLPPLIPSVVGLVGDEDTPVRLSVAVASRQLLDQPEATQRVLAAGLARAVEICGDDPALADQRHQARSALDLVPGAVAWVDRLEVRGRINRKAYAERCAPTMVRCSIEGVMNAGGPEADARLRDLLGVGIDAVKAATSLPQPEPPRRTPPQASPWSRGR
ncbi:MAG: hypothetical protein H6529_17810 [Nocardioides sp.]|nr:hypothetical protein [Nocardioidaceae bacterium]MCB8958322.1 hypothetical protein [Nocardioides sp.]